MLSALGNHKDLGIHSEMFADGVVDLVNKGCVTNAKKVIHKGRIVGSFLIGTKKLYDFVDNNPFIGKAFAFYLLQCVRATKLLILLIVFFRGQF